MRLLPVIKIFTTLTALGWAATIFAGCCDAQDKSSDFKYLNRKEEKLTMNAEIIQNNIKDVYMHLYKDAKFVIKNFGDVVVCDSGIPSASFNVIFNYATTAEAKDNLTKALAYAATKKYPFLLVQTQEEGINVEQQNKKSPSETLQVQTKIVGIAAKYDFQKIGGAARVAINHVDINFANVDKSSVKLVNSEEMFVDWCAIGDAAFSLPAGSVYACHAPVARLLLSKNYQIKLYLAYDKNSVPVGATLLYLPNDVNKAAGHYFWGVKAEHRRQGVMSNMVKNMILIAKEHGYSMSVAQCFDTSVNLAENLGFKRYGSLDIYTNAKEEAH